jgi:hypothetical protein
LKGSIDDYIKSNLESTTVNHAYQVLCALCPSHFVCSHVLVFVDPEKSSGACQAYCKCDKFLRLCYALYICIHSYIR